MINVYKYKTIESYGITIISYRQGKGHNRKRAQRELQ